MKIWFLSVFLVLASLLTGSSAFADKTYVTCDEGVKGDRQHKLSATFESNTSLDNIWKRVGENSFLVPYKLGWDDKLGTTSARIDVDLPTDSKLPRTHFDMAEFLAVNVFSARGEEESLFRMFHGRDRRGRLDVILNLSNEGLMESPNSFRGYLTYRAHNQKSYSNINVVCSARALN